MYCSSCVRPWRRRSPRRRFATSKRIEIWQRHGAANAMCVCAAWFNGSNPRRCAPPMPIRPPKHQPRLLAAKQNAEGPTVRVHDRRISARERGYTWEWEKARRAWLEKHPDCVHCLAERVVTAATVVDHIVPHKGDMKLFWDSSNWQSLCGQHHNKKTAMEDGGFGNAIKTRY